PSGKANDAEVEAEDTAADDVAKAVEAEDAAQAEAAEDNA
ncbi:30S ribosomal protein S16, partial [Geobacillus sp. MMMUD3]|nr:30S ribosomal protein S16 [Geobacillus sp. MMMUD3]